jgi:hypothetical protein
LSRLNVHDFFLFTHTVNKSLEPPPADLALQIEQRFSEWLAQISWLKTARDLSVPERTRDAGGEFAAEVDTPGDHKIRIRIKAKSLIRPSDVDPLVSKIRRRTKQDSFESALRHAGVSDQGSPYLILAAPWLSPRTIQKIAMEQDVGWFDLAGNAHIDFPGAYIHVEGIPNPFESKERTITWTSRHAQRVLRELLHPEHLGRSWKQRDLASECFPNVSLGTVNKVAKRLVESAYAEETPQGLRLTDPEGLLRDWAKSYRPIHQTTRNYYTTLHGEALQNRLREVFLAHQLSPPDTMATIALASSSAAAWFAPLLRSSSLCCYATPGGERALVKELELQPADKGANVTLWVTPRSGAFRHRIHLPSGITTTSMVQTYLDLWSGGERSQEAAEHLLTQKLKPLWTQWQSTTP